LALTRTPLNRIHRPAAKWPEDTVNTNALILIVDIFDFARFVGLNDVFDDPAPFLAAFRTVIRQHFPADVSIEELACGAMVVRELPRGRPADGVYLAEFLAASNQFKVDFQALCGQFAGEIKKPGSLRLGCSVLRGMVSREDEESEPPTAGTLRPWVGFDAIHICPRSPADAA
jgi:hypothetical protein